MTLVAVALGSNLGDRRAHLEHARARLTRLLIDACFSREMDTEPVGVRVQPRFLNAAAVGRTALDPHALLRELLAIEAERGRVRPAPGVARTLDLDLILFGDRIVESPDLILPHPRFRERRFVLSPLAEIAPDMVDPVSGLTIRDLVSRLG